ncbi:hypothetical protein EBBID32_12900 [Sphingobium indicum BiD32]|uniref:Uncharacterized protein n=1 Tax=Sphingobium indicum BiD32 TaxID=1301087 RepID=N1MJ06_9SPHN|nr:hypothetical protein [Sphingobium indicum]CCW16951.1 hypothetical protein EBBID32_12900 [Sphingobium indicum BiD32]
MSRYEPQARAEVVRAHGPLTIAVGWDAPLNTYFAAVHRNDDDVDDEHREILWIGTTYGEIAEPETVIDAITRFADVDGDLAATLRADRLREGHRPRSPWIR